MAPLAERKFQGDASDDQAATAPRAVSAARHRENTARQYAANDQAGDLLDQGRPSQRLQIPCAAIGALFATADAAAITLASLLGAGGYQQFISHVPWNLNFHVGAGLTAALLYGLIGRSSGFYLISDIFSIRRNTSSIVWQLFFTALLLALLAFLFRIGIEFSRGSIICFTLVALPLLFASRSLMKGALASAVRRGRVQGRRVILVGLRDELAVISQTELLLRFGLTEVARVAFPKCGSWSLAANKGILESLDAALALARDREAEEIVLALCWNDPRSIELVRERLRSSPLPVQLLPDQKVRNLIVNPSFSVGRSFAVGIQRAPLSKPEQFAKRVFDIATAGIALVLLLPLLLLTALAIKLDSPGPVFFRQQRSGFNAKRFLIFKFRTMTVMEDGNNVTQATQHDPRISRFGAILRATSIDELPQLFNVLLGDMSLIGPRPHALAHDGYYSRLLSEYAFRHHVKPGITGWAQIQGARGRTEQVELMKKRVDFDLWYINNWSVGLDLLILLRTFAEVLRHRNAY
ncbi:MAG: undecaprenyl-phosphate glucose phosphotransferase [Alphaproteobacteria bacterium]|nr:MAG: undecaprenyl-phosphate glucose phosphotransferase [Alphaproteobacteria bacterium]